MKKFFLLNGLLPVFKVTTESGGANVLCASLFGWTFYTPAYDMVEFGHCRNDEFDTCVEVTETVFNEAVAARVEFFAARGHKGVQL